MAGSGWIALHTYVCILGWPCHFRRARNLGLERIFCGEVDGDRRIRISILNFVHSVTSLKNGMPIAEGEFITSPSAATPLPAALPLFATGLGALGLFGWRRKRKEQTVGDA